MRPHAHRGFTLVELLIVIAIIGILLALLGPALKGAWAMADQSRCTSNLYYLSQAISMRRADAMQGSKKSDLRSRWWPSELMPYLESGATILVCPAGAAGAGEGGGAYDEAYDGTGAGADEPDPVTGTRGSGVSLAYPPLSDLAELRLSGGKAFQPLDAGVWTLKLSEEQYQEARSLGFMGADGAKNLRGAMDTNYRPGADPYLYYLCFEDNITTGGDMDFNDTMIRVTDHRNGMYDLTIAGHTAGAHALVTIPDHQVILALPTSQYYQNQQVSVGQAQSEDTDEEGGGTGGSSSGGSSGGGSSAVTIVGTNYGMNGDYPHLITSAGRVALMDYCRYLIKRADVWTDPKMDPNQDGVPIFARHGGMVNVLMTDGSVVLMDPAEIDPSRVDAARYWTP
ncbi:MAG: type II secretion system protein [Planctomycetes bacterium]|nr:type II secretion system protein [Planctomycetota bacterium]